MYLLSQSNYEGDGPLVVVTQAYRPLAQTEGLRTACGCAMELDGGRAACVGNDFQVDPTDSFSPGASSKGLGYRLFGCETGSEGFDAITAVAQFGLSVKALQEPLARWCGAFVSRDGPANAFDFDNINTSAQDHSSVGVLAAEFRLNRGVLLSGR